MRSSSTARKRFFSRATASNSTCITSRSATADNWTSQTTGSISPDPTPLTLANGYLRSGYNHGGWNGPGIVSSTLDAFHGLLACAVPSITGEAFVRSARYGDADFSGRVDFTDLLKLAQKYGHTNASWIQGDFDYDGTVGFSDLLKLAQNYGALGSVGAAAATPPALVADDQLPIRRRRRI